MSSNVRWRGVRILRWISVPAAGLAAWYAAFIVGLFTYGRVERIICPSGDFVSGTCMNATVGKFMQGWIVLFVAISGTGVVGAATWAAPTHKALVAWLVLAVGASVALLFAVQASMYFAGAAAILSGAATAVAIARRDRARRALGPGGATSP
jgi:hypothetical protein